VVFLGLPTASSARSSADCWSDVQIYVIFRTCRLHGAVSPPRESFPSLISAPPLKQEYAESNFLPRRQCRDLKKIDRRVLDAFFMPEFFFREQGTFLSLLLSRLRQDLAAPGLGRWSPFRLSPHKRRDPIKLTFNCPQGHSPPPPVSNYLTGEPSFFHMPSSAV